MKLYHPTIPGRTVTVKPAEADAWVESGWRKSAPKGGARIVGEKRPERFEPQTPGTVIKRDK